MGKIKEIIRILIFASVGVYIGKCIWLRYDYFAHPYIYQPYSAPWYTLLIPYTVTTLALVAAEIIAYITVCLIIKKKQN